MFWFGIFLVAITAIAAHQRRRQERAAQKYGHARPKTRALRGAFAEFTLFGALTPTWLFPFSVFRQLRRKQWWEDEAPLPRPRATGSWDNPDQRDDDVVVIVEIDFDIRSAQRGRSTPETEKD